MRHFSALVRNWMMGTAATLLLAVGARPSGAQIVFDDLDWTTDRGNIVFDATSHNAIAHRPGLNGVTGNPAAANFPKLDSKRALRRWVWPTTSDLFGDTLNPVPTTTSVSVIVDNPYFDAAINANLNKSNTAIFTDSIQSPDSLSLWTPGNGFTIPAPADRAISPAFSFSFTSRESDPTIIPPNPPDAATGDYGYTYAHHNDFFVDRAGTTPDGPATAAELALLPNADQRVYAAVQKVLVDTAQSQPLAQWTLGSVLSPNVGTGNVPAGTYNISLYSPGGGTIIHHNGGIDVAHPNLQRGFVRVSWGKNTVVGGVINPGTGSGRRRRHQRPHHKPHFPDRFDVARLAGCRPKWTKRRLSL